MANLKLSQLPVASALAGDEIVPVVQGGQTRRSTAAALADARRGAWVAPTLNAPWTNFGDLFAAVGYRKDGNRVQLRGVVKSGAGGTVVFVLPAALRPSAQLIMTTLSDVAAPTRIDVRANGEVFVGLPPSAQVAWLTLDGISYCTDQ
ncbi:hypothetical protein GLE_0038 [Lysobacter enzymogenes]|uniref:Uncharacterized protein n=1 Tax=Lysobacter enzymogenes TaxID=69 RepID=A0A0S2DA63_LYSEN|nr:MULTISPECIES: hypothetical protein [Lysobacter]ALN55397.1 hypothetical protein GLE_0038 [Lysobacter enzymogenes]QCW24483.1 hypothetical protein FE772_01125 [Lysobacter enzymogenes]